MERKKFIKTCGYGCLGMMGAAFFLEGCSGPRYLRAEVSGQFLLVPLSAFESGDKEENRYRKYIVAYNNRLQAPIAVFRISGTEYEAVLMKCTHQGTDLQLFGDRFQCPAHGSEFSQNGDVRNGPAERPLSTFQVLIEGQLLKIDLG